MSIRTRILEGILAAVGLAGVVLSVLAIPRAGIGWDAGIDTSAALDVRAIPPGSSLSEAYDIVFSTSEFYGVFIQWTADLLSLLARGESPLPTDAALTYQLQAAVTVTLSVLSAATVGIVVAYLLGSRLVGLFIWATVMTVPLLSGLAVIDFKDSPVSSGILLVSSGAVLLWQRATWRIFVVATVLIAVGVFVALGVRIGSWPLVGAVLAGSAIGSIGWSLITRHRQGIPQQVASPLLGTALGLLGVFALNPIARIDLPRWAFDAFQISRSYPWLGSIRTLGVDVASTQLPWWYVPAWFAAQMTVIFTAFVLVGVVFWFVASYRDLRGGFAHSNESARAVMLVPFAIQGLALPVLLVVAGATLYDGIRHVAFAIPALVVLSAPLVAALGGERVEQERGSRIAQVLATIVIVAVPASGLVGLVRWFPYSYAHVNAPTAAADSDRNWEYDFWGTTIVEGAETLRDLGVTRVVVGPPIDQKGTAEVVGIVDAQDVPEGERYGLYVFRRYDAAIPSEGCQKVFDIIRGGITLGEGAICEK